MSLFLHNLAHILQEMVQDFARVAARIFLAHFLQDLARIGARLCKNRARKGTYRMHVLHARFLQDSCTILHDLASSFLLGRLEEINQPGSKYANGLREKTLPGTKSNNIIQ